MNPLTTNSAESARQKQEVKMMGLENEKPHTGFNHRVNVIMADSDAALLDIGVMISAKWMIERIKHGFYSLDVTGGTVAEHLCQFPIPQPCQSMCEICESVFTQDELCNAIEVGFEKRKWHGVIIDYIQIATRGEEIPGRLAEIAKKYDKPIVCLSKMSIEGCNPAALRAALKAIGGLCDRLIPTWDGAFGRIKDITEAALTTPARNCDRFASAEEAWDAYDEWVESYRAQGKTAPFNEFGWLFAPATEQEGGAK